MQDKQGAPAEIWRNVAVFHPEAAAALHATNRMFRAAIPREMITEAQFQRVWYLEGSLYGCLLWVIRNELLPYLKKICHHVISHGSGWKEGCAQIGVPYFLEEPVHDALIHTSFDILAYTFQSGIPVDVARAIDTWVKEDRWDVILSAVQHDLISSDGVINLPFGGIVDEFVADTVKAAGTTKRVKHRRYAMSIALRCVREATSGNTANDWVLGEGLFAAIRAGCDDLVPMYFPLIDSDRSAKDVLSAALIAADTWERRHVSSAIHLEWRRRNRLKIERGILSENEVAALLYPRTALL